MERQAERLKDIIAVIKAEFPDCAESVLKEIVKININSNS